MKKQTRQDLKRYFCKNEWRIVKREKHFIKQFSQFIVSENLSFTNLDKQPQYVDKNQVSSKISLFAQIRNMILIPPGF